MLRSVLFCVLAVGFVCRGADSSAISLESVQRMPAVRVKLEGNGRSEVKLSVSNGGKEALKVAAPAGLILESDTGDRVAVLRGADLEVAAGGVSDAELPAAALSTKNAFGSNKPFSVSQHPEESLKPLLEYLSTRPDVPRSTSQLIVLALLENANFSAWQKFLASQRGEEAAQQPHPSPAEVTQAIDALGVLREIAPGKEFALANDAELKFRALRNPVCRGKAMQLYGMNLSGDAPPGGTAPDLGQLLHTKPGDNCPICRMRAQMQGAPSDL